MANQPNGQQSTDAAALSNGLKWQSTNERGYEILEQPYGTRVPKRVIAIGAGATGICLAKFAEDVPDLELVVYEKNEEIGGTWWENRYPGCACDIPAHIYQFQWALNPNWSAYYADAAEIFQYFKDVVDKHDLRKYMVLQHKVIRASWDGSSKWIVEVERPDGSRFEDRCDFLVNGAGLLNNWKWPDIKGLHSFKGTLVHSANYDKSILLQHKKVAVFGAGSSGVQIVANVQPVAKQLYHWIRSPLWISSGFASAFAGPDGGNFKYSEKLKSLFAQDPKLHSRYVKMLDSELGKRFMCNISNTKDSLSATVFARVQMQEKLKDRPDLTEKLIPKTFGVGCRRPTPGNGYLEALLAPNVTVFTEEVRQITPTGFIDHEGNAYDVDVIICATGFDTSFVPRFPILANGKDLRKEWTANPVAYMSTMIPDFPNYVTSLGPYSAANGSLIPAIEHTCRYVLEIIEKCQLERIKALSPKKAATAEFQEHADLLLKRTVWNERCRSWYKNGSIDGIPRVYPGSRAHFMEIAKPRYEDFEIEYESDNRYQFMGNGFAAREFDGRDISWYLGLLDGRDQAPDYTELAKLVATLSLETCNGSAEVGEKSL